MAYWSHLPFTHLSQSERWIRRKMSAHASGESDERVIIDASLSSSTVLGKVCLQRRPDGHMEIGILVLPQHWRRGIARAAVVVMIDEAFRTRHREEAEHEAFYNMPPAPQQHSQLPQPPQSQYKSSAQVVPADVAASASASVAPPSMPHRVPLLIRADVDPRNAASLALLGQCGFRTTGTAERTFRLGNQWADSVYLEVDEEEFRAAQGTKDALEEQRLLQEAVEAAPALMVKSGGCLPALRQLPPLALTPAVPTSVPLAVHSRVTCDGCEQSPLLGTRYRCTQCTTSGGFDLCRTCYADASIRGRHAHQFAAHEEPVVR